MGRSTYNPICIGFYTFCAKRGFSNCSLRSTAVVINREFQLSKIQSAWLNRKTPPQTSLNSYMPAMLRTRTRQTNSRATLRKYVKTRLQTQPMKALGPSMCKSTSQMTVLNRRKSLIIRHSLMTQLKCRLTLLKSSRRRKSCQKKPKHP